MRLSQPRIRNEDSMNNSPERSRESFLVKDILAQKNLKLRKVNVEERQELFKKYLEKIQNSRQNSPDSKLKEKTNEKNNL